jgi:energy-coupling factor transporter ATP-binding protein EcfA2
MHQCKIKKWDPSACKLHRIYLLVGRRGSGKTVLLRQLMYVLRDKIDFCMAFCPTVESRNMLKEHLPEACVFDRLVQSKVDETVHTMGALADKGRTKSILAVFDDCLYDKKAFSTKSMREIFFNGRHLKITAIILVQYLVDICPSLRANVDYCVCFKDNIISNKMRLWKFMFGLLSTLDDFISVMDRCTQNYECLVLDNTGASSAISDSLFWYKADATLPKFKVGAAVFFALSRKMKRSAGSAPPMLVEGFDGGRSGRRPRLQVIKEDAQEEAEGSDNEEAR